MDIKAMVTDGFESIEIMKFIYQPVGTGVLDCPKNNQRKYARDRTRHISLQT